MAQSTAKRSPLKMSDVPDTEGISGPDQRGAGVRHHWLLYWLDVVVRVPFIFVFGGLGGFVSVAMIGLLFQPFEEGSRFLAIAVALTFTGLALVPDAPVPLKVAGAISCGVPIAEAWAFAVYEPIPVAMMWCLPFLVALIFIFLDLFGIAPAVRYSRGRETEDD
jgi:hypothetical protein